MNLWFVAFGSAVGGVLRVWVGEATARSLGTPYLGTMVVNVTGSLLIGFLAAVLPTAGVRAFLLTGLLGGYTTFSTFSLQTLELLQARRWMEAALNVAFSVSLSLGAAFAGYACAERLVRS